jgi:hypothetical protein
LSVFWGAGGAGALAYDAVRNRPLDMPVLLATLIGAVVIGYYLVRYLLR